MGFFRDIRRNKSAYLLVLPAVVYVFIYGYCTFPYALIAFKKYNYRDGLWGSPWNGFENFRFFFSSMDVWNVTFNTIKLNFLFLVGTISTAVILALLFNEVRGKLFKKVTQSVMIFPYFLSWVVISYILYGFLGYEYGFINVLLNDNGLKPHNWYNDPSIWVGVLVALRIWHGAGYNMVIFLSTITGMDETIFEAAIIDGANRFQRILYIILPLLMPTVSILTLMAIGRIFNGDFGMIYAMVGDNGIILPRIDVIDTFVFRALRKLGEPSWATAVGLYQSLMGFIMIFLSNYFTKKRFEEGSLF